MEKDFSKLAGELKSIKSEIKIQNEILKKLVSSLTEGLAGIKKEISDL